MPGEGETADSTEVKLSELHTVINYVHTKKEIVNMQLELCMQENPGIKMQFHANWTPQ